MEWSFQRKWENAVKSNRVSTEYEKGKGGVFGTRSRIVSLVTR